MAYTSPRTWVAAETVTAAIMNAHVRDNLTETAVAKVTTQGDMVYATAANALTRLAKGTTRQRLMMNAGATAPEWGGQPYEFLAYLTGTASNVTGAGATYTLATLTAIKNEATVLNVTSGVFTAPVTGVYVLRVALFLEQLTSAMTTARINFVTSNRTYFKDFNAAALRDASNNLTLEWTAVADMDAADTASATLAISSGAAVVDVAGSDVRTHFGGFLIG